MMQKKWRVTLLATTLILSALTVSAQLASWEVTGKNAAAHSPLSATTKAANVLSANLTIGSGVSAASATDTFGGSGFDQTSLASAITNGDYISFNVTPASGFSVSISSISFLTGLSTATTFNGYLFSSVTGFTTSDSLFSYSFSTASASNQSVVLSSIQALQSLTSAVEFRLYGFRDTTGTSTFRIRTVTTGDDLIVSGTSSPVPEPATYAFFGGLAVLCLAVLRRRPHLS